MYAEAEILASTAVPTDFCKVANDAAALMTNPCRNWIIHSIRRMIACGQLWIDEKHRVYQL